eukprot:TRINITY_DN55557_c0_g2_i2.p1 TRINITY_DN55557_c0_g2~~TRINITY_DN55557_c0_g2_i2.p1  ORF type:complete len:220 (+),score=53.12 TRINITY_DN55557_c0_g2_i2:408-1067(+)
MHTVVLSEAGDAYSFGYGFEGALGHGSKDSQKLPKKLDLPENAIIKQAACGRNFTLLLTDDGTVFAFGDDGYGQLGLGRSERYVRTPQKVQYLAREEIVSVFAGENHSAALTSSGELYLWGYNASGQLGNGSIHDLVVPTKLDLPNHAKPVDVSLGGHHTFVRAATGEVYVFGRGREGQLGISASGESVAAYRNTPVVLPSTSVVQVTAGGDHSGALVK